MPRIHPKEGPMEALVAQLTLEQRRLLRHALGCDTCRAALLAALDPADSNGPGLGRILPWRATEKSYGATIDSVLRRLEPRLCVAEREQAAAPALVAELLGQPAGERPGRLAADDRFATLAVAHLLFEAAQKAGFDDGMKAAGLAELALAVIDRLEVEHYGTRLLEDARGHAWAILGNARRIVSDLRAADEALDTAEAHLARGTGDRLERAYLLQRRGSVRRAQRRFSEASTLFESTIAIYLRAGELHEAGRATINLANVTHWMGDSERAIEQLQRAMALIDPQVDGRLNLDVRHNLITYLAESGRLLEAQALLARSADLYRRHGGRTLNLRRLWVSGGIARDLGRLEEAAELLREVRQGFIEDRVGYDAALAALDLAGVCAQLGRTAEVKRIAEEIIPVFRSRDVHRETLAALILFQRAAATDQATAGMVQEIARYLRHAPREVATPAESKA